MRFKVLILAAVVTTLFILSGCQCPCSSTTGTCPVPEKVAFNADTP